MKKYIINFTERDIEIIKSWMEDRIGAGHWGDGVVMSEKQDHLFKIFEGKKSGEFSILEGEIMQIIHDAEKCFTGKFGMFNPVGSIFEIATLYKLNKAIGKGEQFLTDWELTENEINKWLEDYE